MQMKMILNNIKKCNLILLLRLIQEEKKDNLGEAMINI